MHVETIKLYENRDDVTLTTYVLTNSREMLNGRKRPGVLVCPGGGYLGCSDREAEPVALRFAAMGYHAFVLRYSTYYGGAFGAFPTSGALEVNPRSVHPGPMRDIGKAFLTLHAHADRWLLDTEKIAICGFSAGGHNCAMYSVYWNRPVITEHFGEPPVVFKPAAAILGYAVCDYRLRFDDDADPAAPKLSDAVSIAIFGTTSPSPELLDEVSPVLHVTAHTPPTFLWATAADTVVPVQHTTLMATALAVAGIPFEAHIFEQGQHGLSLANQATAGSPLDMEADTAQWAPLAETWLAKRFALDVPSRPGWMEDIEADAITPQ